MEPGVFEQFATLARLLGVLVAPAIPTFRHAASVRCFELLCGARVRGLPDSGSVGAGGIWHQPTQPDPCAAEALLSRADHESAGRTGSPTDAHCGLRTRALTMGDPTGKEHGREMGLAHALHRAGHTGRR